MTENYNHNTPFAASKRIGGEVVSTTAFVLGNAHHPLYQGAYFRLVDGNSEAEKAAMFSVVMGYAGANS